MSRSDAIAYRHADARARRKKMRRMWVLYAMLVIPLAHVILFKYVPMYGIQMAFKNFKPAAGIWGSKWNDLRHFRIMFSGQSFMKVFFNTLYISVLRLLISFPAPVLFALLLNELRSLPFKKAVQTISYLPHFMSWVVLAGIVKEVLSPTRGIANTILAFFGFAPVNFLAEKTMFVPILLLSDVWQSVGWSAIIYLATLSAIDPALYEAADIDGANRLQKAWHVTIPGLIPIIIIQYILRLGNVLDAGFDQVFNLMNDKVLSAADIIDTYVYRIGLQDMKYDLSTAVGLFKNLIGVTLIVGSNFIIKRYSEYGIW